MVVMTVAMVVVAMPVVIVTVPVTALGVRSRTIDRERSDYNQRGHNYCRKSTPKGRQKAHEEAPSLPYRED